MEEATIRKATINDLNLLLKWRMEAMKNVFELTDEPSEKLYTATQNYYKRTLLDGTHFAIFAEISGEIVGCGGICFYQEMPSPDNPTGQCAYFMNIYTRDSFRGKGIGGIIVQALLDEAKKREISKIYLETTPQARPLYESFNFTDMIDYLSFKGDA